MFNIVVIIILFSVFLVFLTSFSVFTLNQFPRLAKLGDDELNCLE